MSKSEKVQETGYEKELGKVYAEQWDYYEKNVVPFENKVISDATSSNDESVYQDISDNTNLGYQRSFGEAGDVTEKNMKASGVDPSSGKFKGTVSSLSDMEASVSSDAKTRSQVDGQERHIDKMSNVMAMGQGEAQESVATLNDIAVGSQREAFQDASFGAKNKANTLNSLAMAGGAFASHKMNQKPDTDFTLPADNLAAFDRSA